MMLNDFGGSKVQQNLDKVKLIIWYFWTKQSHLEKYYEYSDESTLQLLL